MRRRPLLSLAVLLPLAIGGCSVMEAVSKPFQAPVVQRGISVDQDQLNELVVGTSTRADVTTLLGSPSAKASFDDNTWLYIAETTQTRVAQVPGIDTQHVLVLTFDDKGVLRDKKDLNKSDAQSVDVVARTTPSPGTEASILQQLLGNIGKFNPTGASSGPGSGSGLNGPGL